MKRWLLVRIAVTVVVAAAGAVVGYVVVSKVVYLVSDPPNPEPGAAAGAVEPRAEGDRAAPADSLAWKVARIVGVSAAFVVVGIVVVLRTIYWVCFAREPGLDGTPEILSARPRAEGGRTAIGKSWLAERQGIRQMYLEGDPFTIGWTNAMLTRDLYEEEEESLIRTARVYVPSLINVCLLGHYILVRNRRLPDYLPDEVKMELLGLSRGYENHHPELGPLYHRLMNYHAAHDIGHAVEDNPLEDPNAVDDSLRSVSRATKDESSVACTAFAAWGGHVPDGHLIAGRNCDLEAGHVFDTNKIVVLFRPQKGHAFISVSWAGWLGVVTGMNDERLFVSINAAHTVDGRTIGTPVCFVVRQVLQYASSIEEAVEIIEKAEVFVSDSFLIADGKQGKALIVEKSPAKMSIRSPEEDYLVCANDFLTGAFEDDPKTRRLKESSGSVARFERVQALVGRAAGELDVTRAAGILRDRRGKDGLDVGSGNRSTINYLAAAHSVVADVTTGTLWVAAAPHQLGAYVPFTINDFDSAPEEEIIPEDPFLTDGGYDEFVRSEELLARGGALLHSGRTAEAKPLLVESSELNPGYFRAYVLLAEIGLKEGDGREAGRLLRLALSKQPVFRRDRVAIEAMLRRAEAADSN